MEHHPTLPFENLNLYNEHPNLALYHEHQNLHLAYEHQTRIRLFSSSIRLFLPITKLRLFLALGSASPSGSLPSYFFSGGFAPFDLELIAMAHQLDQLDHLLMKGELALPIP